MTDWRPKGFGTLTPFLIVEDGARMIDFAKKAFGAEVVSSLKRKNGELWNAELNVGSSKLLIAGAQGSQQPFPGFLYFYVEDTDAAYRKAIEAGAISLMEPSDQFYGDRNAGVMDPDKNVWWFATRVEDLTDDQIKKRAEAFESSD